MKQNHGRIYVPQCQACMSENMLGGSERFGRYRLFLYVERWQLCLSVLPLQHPAPKDAIEE